MEFRPCTQIQPNDGSGQNRHYEIRLANDRFLIRKQTLQSGAAIGRSPPKADRGTTLVVLRAYLRFTILDIDFRVRRDF